MKIVRGYEVFGMFETPLSCLVECASEEEALLDATEQLNTHNVTSITIVATTADGRTMRFIINEFTLNWERVFSEDDV